MMHTRKPHPIGTAPHDRPVWVTSCLARKWEIAHWVPFEHLPDWVREPRTWGEPTGIWRKIYPENLIAPVNTANVRAWDHRTYCDNTINAPMWWLPLDAIPRPRDGDQ